MALGALHVDFQYPKRDDSAYSHICISEIVPFRSSSIDAQLLGSSSG